VRPFLVSLALFLNAIENVGKIVVAVSLRRDWCCEAKADVHAVSWPLLRRRRSVAPAPFVEPCRRMLGVARIFPAPLGSVAHGALQDFVERGLPRCANEGLHGVGSRHLFWVEAPEVVKALRSGLSGSSGRESVVKIVIRFFSKDRGNWGCPFSQRQLPLRETAVA